MIVSFALLVILVTTVSMVIPSALKIYYGVRAQNEQRTIAFTISNRIKADLQKAVGVGNSMDGISGEGYLCLTSGGAIADLGTLTDTNPLRGSTVEFVYEEGVMEQIDAGGFNGVIVRNNSRIIDNRAITPGALMARYYMRIDGDWQRKIKYVPGNYIAAPGVSTTNLVENDEFSSAYAIESQYGEGFYRDYEVKINYEIPKAAIENMEFDVYEGKTVKASFVKFVDYTIELYQRGEFKYKQKFCANIENAVPYQQSETTITPGSGGTLPEDETPSMLTRDPNTVGPGYKPVDEVGWGIIYTYMFTITPPKNADGSRCDVSEWKAEFSLAEYDSNATFLGETTEWYTKYGSPITCSYDSNSKKVTFSGQSLMAEETYKCPVKIQVKHDWQQPPAEKDMLPVNYPVTVTYQRNYVTGNEDVTDAPNFQGVTDIWGTNTTLHYELHFKKAENENRLLTFDYTFPFVINDVSKIQWEFWQNALDIKLLEKTDHSTTVRFRCYDLQKNDDTVRITISGLNLPLPKYDQHNLWDYKGEFHPLPSLDPITVEEKID